MCDIAAFVANRDHSAQGRVHTSAVTVAVLPEAREVAAFVSFSFPERPPPTLILVARLTST